MLGILFKGRLVKTWTIKDPDAPIENTPIGSKSQGNAKPMHFLGITFLLHLVKVQQKNIMIHPTG